VQLCDRLVTAPGDARPTTLPGAAAGPGRRGALTSPESLCKGEKQKIHSRQGWQGHYAADSCRVNGSGTANTAKALDQPGAFPGRTGDAQQQQKRAVSAPY